VRAGAAVRGCAALAALVVCTAAAGARGGAAAARPGVPVLMYHRVDAQLSARDPVTVSLTVLQPAFERQLRLLAGAGYHTITLGALREAMDGRRGWPARAVVLTFDDGYEDAYSIVYPLLRRYRFTGAFFVVTSSVGTPDHLTAAQVREMAMGGMEIESHGVHHLDFTRFSPAEARRELVESRARLEAWTGRPVRFFAYPAGRYNAALERLLAALGYRGALTERPGFVTAASPPFAMERVRISHAETEASFAGKAGLPLP
jgi:peptidoglycan/xylan/chitin deacetylase (PgdA/CDA1 family)